MMFLMGYIAGVLTVPWAWYIWRSYTIAREARKLRKQLDEGGVELFLGEGRDDAK